MSIAEQIAQLRLPADLSAEAVGYTIDALLCGSVNDDEARAWLLAMQEKPVSAPELAAARQAVMALATPFPTLPKALDCCGTGGDGAHTLNVSTATAVVVAASGVQVVKHGNRAVSSQAGSADVLQALGVNLDAAPETLARAAATCGLAFLFAPMFHPGLARIAPLRRSIGKRTLFNLLGPLCNPARPGTQLMGVYGMEALRLMAECALQLGMPQALVVHSADGTDELSISAESYALHVHDGRIDALTLAPEDAGLPRHAADALRGGDAASNAAALRALLEGAPGAYRDAVLLNAAACLWLYGAVPDMKAGALRAAKAIDSGAARKLLEDYVALCHS